MYQLWCSLRTCFVDESTFEANILFFQRNILIWLSLVCLDEGLNVTAIHPSATGSKKNRPISVHSGSPPRKIKKKNLCIFGHVLLFILTCQMNYD